MRPAECLRERGRHRPESRPFDERRRRHHDRCRPPDPEIVGLLPHSGRVPERSLVLRLGPSEMASTVLPPADLLPVRREATLTYRAVRLIAVPIMHLVFRFTVAGKGNT